MKRVACLIGLLAVLATPAMAQEPVEREHVVRDGDTLWDLAAYYYSNPFDWPTIYEANTTVVEDPHWIYPQEVLIIPGVQGETEPTPRPQVDVGRTEAPLRTVFYRPPPPEPQDQGLDPTTLEEPEMTRVPVRSGQFNSAPYVDDPDELDLRGTFIAAIRENRDVGGAPTAHPQDEVYLLYEGINRPEVGQRLLLMEVGRGMPGGREIVPTGVLRVTRLEDEAMFGVIETQYAEIYRGQVAVTMPMYPDFEVEEATELEEPDLAGEIIEFIGEPPLPSITDLGYVDRGAEDGVKVGDIFTAYLPQRAARERELGDVFARLQQLPPERVGRLRVIRVGPEVATVRVEHLWLPRMEAGLEVRRTHRIP